MAASSASWFESTGIWSVVERINAIKERNRLACPGSYENLHREVKSVFTTQTMIEGARFDISSVLSPNFQVSHSFSWGSAQYPPAYNFMANYQADKYLLSGQVDHDGGLQARAFYFWTPQQMLSVPAPEASAAAGLDKPVDLAPQPPQAPTAPTVYKPSMSTKVQAQVVSSQAQSMLIVEQDYVANWGPTPGGSSSPPSTLTGNYSIQFLQSLTQSLAGGYSLAVRYAPPPSVLPSPSTVPAGSPSPFMTPNPRDPTQIFSATLSNTGLLHASYWRRLNQRLEIGTELQMLATPASRGSDGKREGIASAGFKLDTVYATVRGMVDSMGRVSSVIEEKMAPGLSFQICGELDYARGGGGQGRVGVGFSLEA
ncbi:eukaryotic porin-domain-containing protein [Chytridium lagenaria]|nr:eukaryotic porin-domain-containing protein [Chytridium lagenaria]